MPCSVRLLCSADSALCGMPGMVLPAHQMICRIHIHSQVMLMTLDDIFVIQPYVIQLFPKFTPFPLPSSTLPILFLTLFCESNMLAASQFYIVVMWVLEDRQTLVSRIKKLHMLEGSAPKV